MASNYGYNTNFYMQDLQNMRDRIDKQMAQIQQQNSQPVPITQNFQLAPNNTNKGDFDGTVAEQKSTNVSSNKSSKK